MIIMDCTCMAHPPIVTINAPSLLTRFITNFLLILVLLAIWNNWYRIELELRPPKTFKMEEALQQKTNLSSLDFLVALAKLLQDTEKYWI